MAMPRVPGARQQAAKRVAAKMGAAPPKKVGPSKPKPRRRKKANIHDYATLKGGKLAPQEAADWFTKAKKKKKGPRG